MPKLKGDKNFMGLTNAECIVAFKHVLDNSDSLYEDAKLLANNGSYGRATSMLIHSTEEMMKAFILFLDGHGFQFRSKVSGIHNLFVNHKLRYGLAMLLSILYILSEDLKHMLNIVKNTPKLVIDFNKDKDEAKNVILNYAQKKIKTICQEVLWFSKAEFLRQDGFYVDYVDDIKTPLQISKKDFDDVLVRIDGMKSFVSELYQSFESNDEMFLQEIDNAKRRFINENWYGHISKLIEKFTDRKNNPFENVLNILSEFSEELNNKIIK